MHFISSSRWINLFSISTLQWPCIQPYLGEIMHLHWCDQAHRILRYSGKMEADIPWDSTGFMHVSLILFLFPEHLCFPGACLHNDPFWMPKCARRPLVRQLHVPRVTKARGRPREKEWRINLKHFLSSLQADRPESEGGSNPTNAYKSYDFVLEIGKAFSTWYLPVFLPVDEICLCRISLAEINWLLPDFEDKTVETIFDDVWEHKKGTYCNCILHMYLSNAPSLADV